jgi:hypothetical protein
MSEIPDDVEAEIVDMLSGQNYTELSVADKFEVTIEQVEQVMVDAGYERCVLCDHWYETYEFVDGDNEQRDTCDQCSAAMGDVE